MVRAIVLGFVAGCSSVLAFWDAGADSPTSSQLSSGGLSKLPEVTDVLEPSSDTITRLQSQVTALNSRIRDIAGNEKSKVASAKEDMESKLLAAQKGLEGAGHQNDVLRNQNTILFQDASKLEKHAREVLDENQGLREILDSLKEKVRMGASFISKMESDADWTGAKELEVLKSDTTDSLDDDSDDSDSTMSQGTQSAAAQEKKMVITKGHRKNKTSSIAVDSNQNKAKLGVKFLDGKLVKFGQQTAAKKTAVVKASTDIAKVKAQTERKESSKTEDIFSKKEKRDAEEEASSGETDKKDTAEGEDEESDDSTTEDEEQTPAESASEETKKKSQLSEEKTSTSEEKDGETSTSEKSSEKEESADSSADSTSEDSTSSTTSSDEAAASQDSSSSASSSPANTSFLALKSEQTSKAGAERRSGDDSQPGEQNLQWMHPNQVDADSSSMLAVLHSELKQLKQQENASIRTLALAFEKKAKVMRRDKDKVLRMQQKLLKKQMQLKRHKKRLEDAVSYVENTKKQLSQSLAQLGGYLRDLAHIALAPPKESGKILPNLNVELDSHEGLVRKDGQ